MTAAARTIAMFPILHHTPEHRREQAKLRYTWAREALAHARQAFRTGSYAVACEHLVHAEMMRGSARWWRG